jgi:Dockerin type I domain
VGANDPCVGGVGAAPCQGLYNADQPGYSTALSSLALAGSSALSRHVPAGLGSGNSNFVAGKTLGEILQRVMDTIAWGQNDQTTTSACIGRGGWIYAFSDNTCQQSDGSTIGWDLLALLDAAASGAAEPGFVKSEFAFALAQGGNNAGSLDYRADNNPATDGTGNNTARAGIYLQGLYYEAGAPTPGDPKVAAAIAYISSRWSGAYAAGDYTGTCSGTQNKGCAYAMYNIFKGLKIQNVTSLPAASDWYAEYQDWLVANQTNPHSTAANSGSWTGGTGLTTLQFSCCATDQTASAAIAELILAPVALIAPDPGLFASVGLSPPTAINPVGTDHTVTAFAQSSGGAPVPGVTITFQVLAGSQNAGKTGSGQTGVDGKTTFTYHDDNGAGTDTIQAFIGTLGSNVVTKTWVVPTIACDVDGDGKVTMADLLLIRGRNGQAASGPNDPYDANHDGKIDVADVRYCQLRLTPP